MLRKLGPVVAVAVLLGGPLAAQTSFPASGYFADVAVAYPWPVWTPAVSAVPPSTTGVTWYVDGSNGDDSRDGSSVPNAFKTIGRAVSSVSAGDTVLILAGLYREGINLVSAPSGTSGKPITFGSYGNGEVILDGSAKVTGWIRDTGNVWKASVPSFVPSAVVVNETPLREVSHGQTTAVPSVGSPEL